MARPLIYKLLLLTGLVLLLSVLLDLALPFCWGDRTQYTKLRYYEQHKENYNAIFFGGSLEYRHIDPQVTDSIARRNGIDLRSFNFGVDGHIFINQLNDIDQILDIPNDSLKYIFVSVSSEAYFFPFNRHTPKWLCWQNVPTFARAAALLADRKEDPLTRRLQYMYYYGTSLVENSFKLGLLPEILDFWKTKDDLDSAYLGRNRDGFFPYDYEEEHNFMEYKWEDTMLLASKHDWETNEVKRDSLTQAVTASFVRYQSTDKPNAAMVDMLKSLIAKGSQKGVDVYFILPCKARGDYSMLLPVFRALPELRCIELADIREYPDLYSLAYGYNYYHLNNKGAQVYSRLLGQHIADLFKRNQAGTP